ncbi:MAG: hypothetical protein RL030_372 [Pseudomonadota bacterium]
MLWNTNELLFALLLILAGAATIEAGYRLGRRWRARLDEPGRNHINAIQVSLLGMLALLLGFTFAMSQSRFEARKALVLDEAGAITVAYSMVQLLPDHDAAKLGGMFEAYVDARLAFFEAGIDSRRIDSALETASTLQASLWTEVRRIMDDNAESERSALLAKSISAMAVFEESRREALQNHVPETILLLLLFVTLVSLGFIAFSNGLSGQRHHFATAFFGLTVAAVLIVTMDLDRPRSGAIQVSQDSMQRVLEAVRADLQR